jgi:hypothetical protein
MMTHSDCCAALALWVLGQHDMARTEAELCEWGRLQAMFDDEPSAGPLFNAAIHPPTPAA